MKKKYLSEHNIYLQKKEIKTREEIDFIRLKKEKEKEVEKISIFDPNYSFKNISLMEEQSEETGDFMYDLFSDDEDTVIIDDVYAYDIKQKIVSEEQQKEGMTEKEKRTI